MDIDALSVAIAVVKSIPGTAANRAETAAGSAESYAGTAESYADSAAQSAALAEQHSYGVSVSGTSLIFTANSNG